MAKNRTRLRRHVRTESRLAALPLPQGDHAGQLGQGWRGASALGRVHARAYCLVGAHGPAGIQPRHGADGPMPRRPGGKCTAPSWTNCASATPDTTLPEIGWIRSGPTRGATIIPKAGTRLLIPKHLRGQYDVPGWTANGVEPWGLQMDPIGADGNLFLQGLVPDVAGLSPVRLLATRNGTSPFDMVRDGENTFTWTHSGIAEYLANQWSRAAEGSQ